LLTLMKAWCRAYLHIFDDIVDAGAAEGVAADDDEAGLSAVLAGLIDVTSGSWPLISSSVLNPRMVRVPDWPPLRRTMEVVLESPLRP